MALLLIKGRADYKHYNSGRISSCYQLYNYKHYLGFLFQLMKIEISNYLKAKKNGLAT
jgi:hypothetical protein